MMALDKKVSFYNPLRTMTVCTKCHGNPLNSCQDISIKNKNVNLKLALEEKSEDPQKSLEVILGEAWRSVQTFMAIHLTIVEILQSDQMTDWHCR